MTDKEFGELLQQLTVVLGRVDSALQTIALRKIPVKSYGKLVIGPDNAIIPYGNKSYNCINLGEGGSGSNHADIGVTGIIGLTAVPRNVLTFAYSLENDQNVIDGPVVFTPASGHWALVQWIM